MMICRFDDVRLLLILQVDHSRVAGLLAAHWGNDVFASPRPYSSMVLAAHEHDSGWWDWEIRPSLNDQGYSPDYIGSINHLIAERIRLTLSLFSDKKFSEAEH